MNFLNMFSIKQSIVGDCRWIRARMVEGDLDFVTRFRLRRVRLWGDQNRTKSEVREVEPRLPSNSFLAHS